MSTRPPANACLSGTADKGGVYLAVDVLSPYSLHVLLSVTCDPNPRREHPTLASVVIVCAGWASSDPRCEVARKTHRMAPKTAPENEMCPPAPYLLVSLPPELLHRIPSQTRTEDLLEARKTCSLLATIGRDYICDEVPLVYLRDSFTTFTRIAEHPRYSKRVRSLSYMVDQGKYVEFDKWDAARPDPRPLEADQSFWDHLQPEHTERDFRDFFRGENKYYEDRQARIAAVPMEDR